MQVDIFSRSVTIVTCHKCHNNKNLSTKVVTLHKNLPFLQVSQLLKRKITMIVTVVTHDSCDTSLAQALQVGLMAFKGAMTVVTLAKERSVMSCQ